MARQVLTIPDVPPTLLQSATAAATYVPLAGGNMTGLLSMDITGTAFQAKRAADTQPRVGLGTNVNSAGGGIEFGSGSVAFDTRLFRSAATQLQTNAVWNNNLELASTSFTFRNGASNFGTPIYAQFGYGGDGTNPRMQFGCNAWFTPYGGTRPTAPTKQVTGLASGLIMVEAAGSGGAPAGRVPLVDFIWQDGAVTATYAQPQRFYNGGSIDLTGTRPVVMANNTSGPSTGFARFGQFANDGLWLSANAAYDGTNWNRDDTTKGAWHVSMGLNTFGLYHAKAAANPISTWLSRFTIDATGLLTLVPDSAGNGLEVVGSGSFQGNNVQIGPRGNNPSTGGRVIYWHDGGTMAWSSGMLAVPSARDFVIYDFISGRTALSISGATGQAAFVNVVQGTQFRALPPSSEFSSYDRGSGLSANYTSFYRHDGITGFYDSTFGQDRFDFGANGSNLRLAAGGTFTVMAGNSINVRLQNSGGGGNVEMASSGGYWHPSTDNTLRFGAPSLRFIEICAVAGAINTSSIKFKDPRGDLDPEAALRAVLRTPSRRFTYKSNPERIQSGYYLEEADPLFTIGPDEASPSNDTGILMGAIQALCARLGVTA